MRQFYLIYPDLALGYAKMSIVKGGPHFHIF